tara:strand:- start:801 stop:1061 length:261 start_codon:yes stop_codon:yes gene_type:complete
MIDTEEQIEFDDVLKEIEVGVDISEGNYDILRYYRDEYKDLLSEVEQLRKGRLDLINEVIRIINNKTGERVDADLHDYIIDRLVNE